MSTDGRERRVVNEAYAVFSSVVDTGSALVMTVPDVPMVPMLNRVVGLGVERPATEDDVDAALAAVGPGVSFYVAVAPDAKPAELPAWLEARGLEPGWGWMVFRRGVDEPPVVESSIRLMPVEDGDAARTFARIARESYGLPPTSEPTLEATTTVGWRCWLALDGGEPIGAAGMYVSAGVGYLGIGATLPAHRGRGAQTALLAGRIREAGRLGCDIVVTETGERGEGRPSNSYRNILRAGFEEVAVTANWQGRT